VKAFRSLDGEVQPGRERPLDANDRVATDSDRGARRVGLVDATRDEVGVDALADDQIREESRSVVSPAPFVPARTIRRGLANRDSPITGALMDTPAAHVGNLESALAQITLESRL
jgi:hypothetical protein